MGFFQRFRRARSKAKVMSAATALVESGDTDTAASKILSYLKTDSRFPQIIEHFSATQADISKIIDLLALNGAGSHDGFFVPVSALLFPDTFAYCMRALRGQVSIAEAAYQLDSYFASNAAVFEPEQAFH